MKDSPRTDPYHRTGPVWLPAGIFRERGWIAALAVIVGLLVLLYIRFVLLSKVNHDEVEHAHVAFRILSGELPYRDFYQNHWPAYWMLVAQFDQAFPFSIKSIHAARGVSLVALAGCWWLGLRLLAHIPAGRTRLSVLVYTAAMIVLAHEFEFYIARPDSLMTLFGTAALCLVPARAALRNLRALGLGILFGLAISFSTKAAPLALVIPLLISWDALRSRSLRPLLAGVSYAAGVSLAVLPTVLWLAHRDLFEPFYFDVFALNFAVTKPWRHSFGMVSVALFMPSLLGVLTWAWARNTSSARDDNGFRVVFVALVCGLLLALAARHPALYNFQILTVPLAIGVASLASLLWLHGRDLGNRLLLIAVLLAYPVSFTASRLAWLRGSGEILPSELQQIMDLARPGGRTCLAFSPAHPVFCKSVSELSNGWDLTFAGMVSEPHQRERFQRIWDEGIERALDVQPDILYKSASRNIWEAAVQKGLIRQDQLDALDGLGQAYEPRVIGSYEFWTKRAGQ